MKTDIIIKEAKEVKAFIEKNKKLPNYCTIGNQELSIYTTSYLFSRLLANPKANDIKLISCNGANKSFTGLINEKIYFSDYIEMIKKFNAYCEANKRVPSYITTIKSKTKVEYKLFVYCLCKIIVFYYNNKTMPNYCEFKSTDLAKTTKQAETKKTTAKTGVTIKKETTTFVSSPHYTSNGCNKLGQCTGWWCGPHSIHQAIRKFGITKYTEKQIAGWAGTTTNGTGHAGLNTAIAKIAQLTGKKLTVQWKNFSDMGSTDAERFKAIGKLLEKKNVAIFWHIAYINGGNGTNGTHFGHYEYIDKINTVTKYVRALNSLGNKKSDGSYTGKLQDRTYQIQGYFAKNTPGGQPALCIITEG